MRHGADLYILGKVCDAHLKASMVSVRIERITQQALLGEPLPFLLPAAALPLAIRLHKDVLSSWPQHLPALQF